MKRTFYKFWVAVSLALASCGVWAQADNVGLHPAPPAFRGFMSGGVGGSDELSIPNFLASMQGVVISGVHNFAEVAGEYGDYSLGRQQNILLEFKDGGVCFSTSSWTIDYSPVPILICAKFVNGRLDFSTGPRTPFHWASHVNRDVDGYIAGEVGNISVCDTAASYDGGFSMLPIGCSSLYRSASLVNLDHRFGYGYENFSPRIRFGSLGHTSVWDMDVTPSGVTVWHYIKVIHRFGAVSDEAFAQSTQRFDFTVGNIRDKAIRSAWAVDGCLTWRDHCHGLRQSVGDLYSASN